MDRKATERVNAGGKDIAGVEDGPDSAGMHNPGNCTRAMGILPPPKYPRVVKQPPKN